MKLKNCYKPAWISLFLCAILLISSLSACSESSVSTSTHAWQLADLRTLDPADAAEPTRDLLAAYYASQGDDLLFRFDLLELESLPDYDLYLALDTHNGGAAPPGFPDLGAEWDVLLSLPAGGDFQALAFDPASQSWQPRRSARLSLLRNPSLDNLALRLDRASLDVPPAGKDITVSAFVTPSGQPAIADQIEPFHTGSPPPEPLDVVLAFWNSYPAYTPAQALRRWDGAHTGPSGGRQGLFNLLRVAQAHQAPMLLLDLNNPASLSALDVSGGLALVQQMQAANLLELPLALPNSGRADAAPFNPTDAAIKAFAVESQQVESSFNLKPSASLFLPGGLAEMQALDARSLAEPVGLAFVPAGSQAGSKAQATPPLVTPYRIPSASPSSRSLLVIPIPGFGADVSAEPQAGVDGPTLTVRRWLAEGAWQANQPTQSAAPPILLLGGDLPLSTWGEPLSARNTLEYLSSRPWIRLLNPQELVQERSYTAQDAAPAPQAQGAPSLPPELLSAFASAPANNLTAAAWQAYQALYQPIFPHSPELANLRRQYTGQIGILLEAARWAGAPAEIATCQIDPDLDGQPECLLANENTMAVFEMDAGGYLAYLFSLDAAGEAHQWLGPSAQVLVGASPANTWDLSRGAAADPGVLPGAFILSTARFDPSERASAQISPGRILLVDPASGARKAFSLLPDGMDVQISAVPTDSGASTRLPLLLDPWLRFQRGWNTLYQAGESENGFSWQAGTARLELETDARLSWSTFADSAGFFGSPEDPNREVPPGHYLPFPFAVPELSAVQDFQVRLRFASISGE